MLIEAANVDTRWMDPVISAIRQDPGAEVFFAGIHSDLVEERIFEEVEKRQAFLVAVAVDNCLAGAFFGNIMQANGLVFVHQIVFRPYRRQSVLLARTAIAYFLKEIWPDCHSLIAIIPDSMDYRASRMVAAGCGFRRVGKILKPNNGKPSESILYQFINPEG
jgi:hypothetical protein